MVRESGSDRKLDATLRVAHAFHEHVGLPEKQPLAGNRLAALLAEHVHQDARGRRLRWIGRALAAGRARHDCARGFGGRRHRLGER